MTEPIDTAVDGPVAHDEDDGGDATAFVSSSKGMLAIQILLGAVGVGVGLYGASLIFEFPTETIIRFAVWGGVGVIAHDFVFAPLAAACGFAGSRLIRGRWWKPVALAALFSTVLTILVVPVYSRPGAVFDNHTVLNQDYPRGFWTSIAIVWACVPVYYLATRWLPVRKNKAVQQEGTDDVEAKPPAV